MGTPVKHYGKWRIRYADHHGKRQSEVFDDKKSAEHALLERRLQSLQRRRNGTQGLVPGKLFTEICDYWVANRAPLKRSGKADESMIYVHLRPFFGPLKLTHISVEDLDQYKRVKLSDLNAKTVHNQLTLLISMLKLAKELNWLEHVPKIKKPRCYHADFDFRYLRSTNEVRRFLIASEDEGPRIHALYATAIYTGLRAGELAGLQWGDIDLSNGLITVQRSFLGPTKSGKIRHVPILNELAIILRKWRLQTPERHVFFTSRFTPLKPSDRIFQEVLHRVLIKANLPPVLRNGKDLHYIRFHDLRHTFASHWVMNNGDIFKLQKILGHQSIQMTMRYAHLSPSAFKEDLARIGFASSAVEPPVRITAL